MFFKIIFLWTFVLLQSLCCQFSFSQIENEVQFNSLLKEMKLKTKIEYYVDILAGDALDAGYKSNVEEYDRAGLLRKSIWYNSDGSMNRMQVFEYDKRNRKSKEKWYSIADTLNTYNLTFDYDNQGNMTHARQYIGDDKLLYIFVQQFDDNGKVTTKHQLRNDSTAFVKSIFQRDSFITTTTDYNRRNKVRREIIDYYTTNYELAKSEEYDGLGSLVDKQYFGYKYDEKNLLIEVKLYNESKRNIGISTIRYEFY